jgi:hypothetical protein
MWKSVVEWGAGIIEGNGEVAFYAILILFVLGAIGWAI